MTAVAYSKSEYEYDDDTDEIDGSDESFLPRTDCAFQAMASLRVNCTIATTAACIP